MTTADVRRGGTPVYLTLRMKPPWVFIDEIRRFVESFCACAGTTDNREAQLALAVHELMQNAVPNSHDDDVELTLEVEPEADRVAVAVTNRCTEAEYHALEERVARMNGEPDALRHYLQAMHDTPTAQRGGLGLARVRFEAQLELSVSRAGGRMTVHASGRLRPAPLQTSGGSR
ncbi:putative anti-sigma regulatory factor (serine/threonine protein kinase) [Anaeromyxobacter sp. K]|uniref:Anti-sigma regulatory factor (Serine/threonine protein kinase) n=2 Tax=Anaeromyxobacteraceae TaxID=1524215 RepID=B8JEJ5_ANAD2|nr:putative anti-sigma regulatory factor (serine/threonine protein kinase) [Anaeromyxobacter sp. K]ACL64321.1 putative anti-sigma regulatory factor (serine/threonine protein kinase) [Anaeromyxobacter dehalogenans 2CP-1]